MMHSSLIVGQAPWTGRCLVIRHWCSLLFLTLDAIGIPHWARPRGPDEVVACRAGQAEVGLTSRKRSSVDDSGDPPCCVIMESDRRDVGGLRVSALGHEDEPAGGWPGREYR